MSPYPVSREEFVERFTARMIDAVGSTLFPDGSSVEDYAKDIALTYYCDDFYLGEEESTPEDWADCDMEYWEDDGV